MNTDFKLLKILICPKCKGKLKLYIDKQYIVCSTCHLAYTIKNHIPIMLVNEAISLENLLVKV